MPRKPSREKRPKNATEAEFFDRMTEEGWKVTRRGWPDFLCIHTDPITKEEELAIVEVVGRRGRRLKSAQRKLLKMLAGYGVPVYQWTPEKGMEPVPPF